MSVASVMTWSETRISVRLRHKHSGAEGLHRPLLAGAGAAHHPSPVFISFTFPVHQLNPAFSLRALPSTVPGDLERWRLSLERLRWRRGLLLRWRSLRGDGLKTNTRNVSTSYESCLKVTAIHGFRG